MPSTAILAAASAIPGPQQPFVAVGSVFSSLFNQHPKDKVRIQAAQDALTRALAGDQSALAYMQAQAVGSATQVGKDAFKAALAAYAQQRGTFVPPVTQTPLQQQIDSTVSAVRQDLATGIQNIGAGATTALAGKVGGDNRVTVPLSIPFTSTQLLVMAAIAGVILLARR